MQPEIFTAIHDQEKSYWWFVGRRKLVRDSFRCGRMLPAVRPKLLDIGCGTGAMLEEFGPLGFAAGTDLSPVALQFCRTRGLRNVLFADGTRLPFADASFECISAMDVIEHIDDDVAVLRECHRVCAAGGVMSITVPALRWLWTTRDERLAHKRRYHRHELMARARQAGFEVEKCSYYTFCMFFPFAMLVLRDRILQRQPDVKQDVPVIPSWLNAVLLRVLLLEQWLMRWIDYPFGVSLYCVLRKPI